MKTTLLFFYLALGSYVAYAQNRVKISTNVMYGWGGISNSGQVQAYFDRMKAENPNIQSYAFTNKKGHMWAFGAYLNYYMNENLLLITGLEYASQSNKMIIDYKVITDQGNGSYDLIHSTILADIHSASLPLILKKKFGQASLRPFVSGGISVDYRFQKLLSVNTEDFTHWDGGSNMVTNQTGISLNKSVEGLNVLPVNFILSAGSDYKIADRVISLSVNYRAAVGKSSFWVRDIYSGSSSGGFSGEVNKVFNYDKQKDISGKYGINLNDWKNSFFYLNLGFTF